MSDGDTQTKTRHEDFPCCRLALELYLLQRLEEAILGKGALLSTHDIPGVSDPVIIPDRATLWPRRHTIKEASSQESDNLLTIHQTG